MTTRLIEYTSEDNTIFFHHSIDTVSNKPLVRKPEIHDRIELLYLKEGNITYNIDGFNVNLTSGDLIFINVRQIHSLTIDLSQPYERYVMRFSTSALPENTLIHHALYENLFPPQSLQFRLLGKDIVKKYNLPSLFSALEKEYSSSNKYYYPFFISSIIQLLIAANKAIETIFPIAQKYSLHPTIKRIVDYINDNLETKLLIKDIANALHFDEYYILHLFKKHMKLSLKQFINLKKMSHAVTLLKEGVKANTVSQRLGYSTYSSFYQRYCKTFKRKPSQTVNANQDLFDQSSSPKLL